MTTLEQIATTPRNKGARRNAIATVTFIKTNLRPNARSKRRRHQTFHSAQKQRAGVRLTELLGGRHPTCNPMGR
jgi:hypothetical protein